MLVDLDGTLLDSGDQVAEVASSVLRLTGVQGADHATLKRRTGESAASLFQEIADLDARNRLVGMFRERLMEVAGGPEQVMPGVVEGLSDLRNSGWRLAVATNKPTRLAVTVLARSRILHLVDHVQGSDDLPHKPAPDILLAAERRLGTRGKWMVGDTSMDVLSGKAAGTSTIGVCGGSHSMEELMASEPDAVVEEFSQAVAEILGDGGGVQ